MADPHYMMYSYYRMVLHRPGYPPGYRCYLRGDHGKSYPWPEFCPQQLPEDVGCNGVKNKDDCCGSFDGRDKYSGDSTGAFEGAACVWCAAGASFSPNGNVCEPNMWVEKMIDEGKADSQQTGLCGVGPAQCDDVEMPFLPHRNRLRAKGIEI